jgi:hypothetical protein
MKTDTKKWKENFNQELVHIQIQFDSFFTKGKLDDYYTLKEDRKTGMLILNISAHNELPKQIEVELIDAFNKSKP